MPEQSKSLLKQAAIQIGAGGSAGELRFWDKPIISNLQMCVWQCLLHFAGNVKDLFWMETEFVDTEQFLNSEWFNL